MKEKLVFRSLGEVDSRLRLGCGFMHKKGWTVDEKEFRFPSFALVYVIRGEGSYVDSEGRRYDLKAGSLFFRHPEVTHSTYIKPDSEWAECFIDLGLDLYTALRGLNIIKQDVYTAWIEPQEGIEQDFYTLMNSLEAGTERDLPAIGLDLMQFCTSLLKRAETDEQSSIWMRVEKSCLDFTRHLDERIDLKEYCANRGWGYESFRKVFTKTMGISPGQYIIHRRIDEAYRLLRSGHYSVKEVGALLGYKSPYEFSAQFRRITGQSPSSI